MRTSSRAWSGPGLLAASLALLAAGCTKHGSSDKAPASVSPAAHQLADRAGKGAQATYAAQYAVSGPSVAPGTTARVAVVGSDGYRLDVTTNGSTSVLLHGASGTASCRLAGEAKTCFQVAGPGQPIPPLFDPAIQQVFTSYLDQLAKHPDQYDVAEAGGTLPVDGIEGRCYTVSPHVGAAEPAVAKGTYCLAATGLPTSVTFASGTLMLAKLDPAPAAADLVPPATPTPLPSPSPS
ncbi:MAG: hypothetical protein NVSMB13_00570 [Mycobacteriales bacterium]